MTTKLTGALIAFVLALCGVAASAAMHGTLTNSEMVTSVTGKLVWKCTYFVGTSYVTVILEKQCPPTMQFE